MKLTLWVKIMNVPLEAWNVEGISRIASRIGNLIIMDRITTSMCEKAYGRASFARVLVEVEAAKGLVDSVEVCYKALGRSMKLRVEYTWRPPVCSHCKVFGHNDDKCTSRVLTDAEKAQRVEVKSHKTDGGSNNNGGDWQTVSNKRNSKNDGGNTGVYRQRFSFGEGSSRGGFAGRERGGFGGRGFGNQRFYRNENVQFVPVNKGKESVNVGGAERGKKNKGTSRMEVDSDYGYALDRVRMSLPEFDLSGRFVVRDVLYDVLKRAGISSKKEAPCELSDRSTRREESTRVSIPFAFDYIWFLARKQRKFLNSGKKINKKDGTSSENSMQKSRDGLERLMNYYKLKLQELVKKSDVDDLKLKIENLERQIAHSHNVVTSKSRVKAKCMVKSVDDWQGLSENHSIWELILISADFDEEVVKIKRAGHDCSISYCLMTVKFASWNVKGICNTLRQGEVCNEVFGVWEWVSNSVDSVKGCRIAMDNKMIFVSVVYGEISPKARTRLWRDLVEHKGFVNNNPWVVLGDFNAVLRFNENSNGLNIQGAGIKDFRECIDSLELEDINMTGLFYTWIQKMRNPELGVLKKLDRIMGNAHFISKYANSFAVFMLYLTSDHSPAILTIPDLAVRRSKSFRFANFLADKADFVDIIRENWDIDVKGYKMFKLARKLKNMKKYMRQMNRRNGNVFEKVKVLKDELSKIQCNLDKDPTIAVLKEEEMVYYSAYREAALDEEKLLKQKTKIEWLRDGDFNSSYFHSVVKGRTSRNRIEMVLDDSGMLMLHTCLFTKRLDADKAMELIKDVTNEEIKEAIFSIEDNKASGPDGFSSKFFKAAWMVIGNDVCAAIKEFFTSGKLLGEFNTTLISLVPKSKTPARVIDYRQISCCNIVFGEQIDPESKNPSSSMPAKASDEFIKPKKITRSSIGKPQLSTGMKHSRRVSFKAGKGNISAKGMEGLVFGDDESEGYAQADLVKNMVNDSGLGIRDKLGPLLVPVDEDPILSSRLNTMGSTRILKKGEVLSDGVSYGNNKLKLIPGRINELGKEVVDMDPVIEEVDGKPLFVQKWEAGLCMVKPEPSKVPLWVKIMNVPLEAWNVEDGYGRASFARVLVEVEAAKGLVDSVEVCYKALGRSMELRVEYPWRPPVCSHCKVFGHNDDKCTSRVLTDAEKAQRVEVRSHKTDGGSSNNNGGDWQTVSNKRNSKNDGGNTGVYRQRFSSGEGSSRGGFAGRGRGGFGGRGFGDQRFYRNENVQFVPVNKGKESVNVGGVERGKKNKGTSRMEVDSDNNNSKLTNNVGSGKKINKKEGTSSENRFAMLSEEIEIEENLEWDFLKAKIDEACEKGFYISMQEKKEWPGEVMNYYKLKLQELVKKSDVDELKLKIENLERQIAHSHNVVISESRVKAKSMIKSVMIEQGLSENQAFGKMYDQIFRDELERIKDMILKKLLAEAELFVKTGQIFTKHELDTWPDEKIEFYKVSIGAAAYEKILHQIRISNNADIDKEVAEDQSGTAQFMAQEEIVNVMNNDPCQEQDMTVPSHIVCNEVFGVWEWVSNSVDSVKGCRIAMDNKMIFVTVVYGEISPKARTRLWRDLVEHKGFVNNNPWVVLGDFNAVLRFNENSNRLNIQGAGIKDFREFFLCLIDYINSPSILTIPDLAVRRSRSFRFANFLADKADFVDIIRENWDIDVKGVVKGRTIETELRCTCRLWDAHYAMELIKDVTNEEIKEAIFSIDDNKASGPDGFSSKFFKAAWVVIGNDVCAAIKEFFTSGKLLGEFNTTLISLVPKSKTPARVIDYRPISCCNIVYKGISKISDNILLAQEFLKGYNWKYVTGCCAFKIDIMKAYDTVSWSFLEFCLKEFGFHPVMINWIMVCLKTASFSVCVNGESHGFFKAKRGLRQGDPISPYLFTLVMEVLNLMVKRQIKRDSRFKYHTGCSKLKITSLCFADDLLMLCHGDVVSTSILRRGLDEFSLASGLYPSMSKSEVFFSNVCPDAKNEILMAMPFREGTLPIRYLGVPLASRRIKASDCRVLIDAVKNRINDWRNKSLSFAGRLQLISSILSSLQNFLWAKEGNTSGMVSIGWKEVCKPKSQGGLGLKPLCAWNEALMAKHLWNIASNKDSIWVKWINIHKLKGRSFWDDGVLKGHSWVWAQLLDLRDRIKNYVNVRIGNGSSCNVWFDKWNSNGPLSKLINHRTIVQFGFSLEDKVCDLIQNGIWSWPDEWEGRFSTVLDVPVPVINHNVDDKVYWVNKKGKEKGFSVAEVWKAIKPEFPKVIWYKHIWYSQCIPRHSFISWIAVKGRLKTKDRLARWFCVSDLSCHLCRNENESHSHLFFACAYSRRLWERLKPMGKMENISNAWANVISWISNKPASNKIWSIIQRLVFGAAIYFIWQERNSRIFQQMDRSEDSLFEVVVSTVRLRLRSLKLKQTPDVIDASEIWGLPIDRSSCGMFMKLTFSLLAQMDVCGLFHRWLTMIWIPVCYETLLFIHRSALVNVMKIELASVYAPMFKVLN
ncbi:RNA-directed DNA polymerase, eukaryota, reverse transcriptase zinc-binding domain protein [Tanacetum coccineum]